MANVTKRFSILSLTVLITVLSICIVILQLWNFGKAPQRVFSRQQWLNWPTNSSNQSLEWSTRQQMLRSLVTEVLPGLSRNEIVNLLGESGTHGDYRRDRLEDETIGSPRREKGYWYDEIGWDLIYIIGEYQSFGGPADLEIAYLLIQLDEEGCYEDFYLIGPKPW